MKHKFLCIACSTEECVKTRANLLDFFFVPVEVVYACTLGVALLVFTNSAFGMWRKVGYILLCKLVE